MKKLYILIFLLITSFGFAQIPSGYYDTATGSSYTLKTQLKNIIDNINDGNGQAYHDTSVTYGQLWTLYETSDARPDGKVWDMYSLCNLTFVTDQDTGTGGTSECDKFNREHSFPRSWFGDNQSLAIFADAFHVIPTDKKVNSIRGNLAFGEVNVANYTSLNGSKKGSSSISGPTGDVFEPADEFKGDIARGLFYVATRYQDLIGGWEANDSDGDSMLDGSNNKVFEQWALDMLYSWHLNDAVSQKEIDRNNAIFNHQDNRNPFIDHPEYVFAIWQASLSVPSLDQNNIIIYPNPVKGNILNIETIQPLKVEIYNVLGKKLITTNVDASKSKVDVGFLYSGIYMLKMTSDQGTVTKRIIKD